LFKSAFLSVGHLRHVLGGFDNAWRQHDQQIGLGPLRRFGFEQPAEQWDIA